MQLKPSFREKKLIIFDLDGTLTESKSVMDREMARLLCALLGRKMVAVIGGGRYELFKEQLLAKLRCPRERLKRLYLFPTTATRFYRYARRGWRQVYAHNLTLGERKRIIRAFERVFKELNYVHPKKTYGKVIEDRGTQVTWSVFGQDVVRVLGAKGVRLKKEWKRKYTPLKMKIARLLQKHLPDLEVKAAGYTSVDVTRRGIDKAYGIKQIRKYLRVPIKDMLFVGDALYPGGNDYAARRAGVECVEVKGPQDTKKLTKWLLSGNC
jgi:phosphomannomutase